jgi:hypothetical protein
VSLAQLADMSAPFGENTVSPMPLMLIHGIVLSTAQTEMAWSGAQDDHPQEMQSQSYAIPTSTPTLAPKSKPQPSAAPPMAGLRGSDVEGVPGCPLQCGIGVDSGLSSPSQCVDNNGMDSSTPSRTNQFDISGDTTRSTPNRSAIHQHPKSPHLPGLTMDIPMVEVNRDDLLCRVIQVEELAGMSLMTSFQPDLKLFVCERCRFAVWADHLTGHIFNNHRPLLSQSIKQSAVEAAVTSARNRLQAAQSPQLKVVLPQRLLPPLPWLLDPVRGHQCRHCPYVAASSGTITAHSKKSHPGKGSHSSKSGRRVLVQHLFSKAQYFIVHVMLQNIGPDDLFAKFYSALPARYIDGAFIDGDMSKTSDPGDLYWLGSGSRRILCAWITCHVKLQSGNTGHS